MRFGVLGPLAVWTADGSPVRVPEVKVRALLARLLLAEGRPVSADRLVEDLWGEEPPGNPANTLQTKVSQLRRALGPGGKELVARQPAGYALRVSADDVDAGRFEALTARARASDDPRARAGLLAEALGLWRGPALADFADEEFARAAITRLAELRLVAWEEHAEVRLALGEHRLLAVELGDLVALHPGRERLRAVHMKALYQAGRQSAALESFTELRERLAEDLGLDPAPELVALHEAILRQAPELDPPTARRHTNLPTPLTELIGRTRAVSEVSALLRAGRLVTLVGSGGVGKTRLAIETATRLAGSFPDGAWLVELATLRKGSAASTAEAIMAVLGVREERGSAAHPADRLTGALRSRRLLLVLDNCEHVVEQVAELAEPLLRAAPELRILATSQEPLGLAGEALWAVPPLELPASDDLTTLEQAGAVRLFVARAAASAPGFALEAGNARAVAKLCRRLDGIPLALELAATRVRALGVHELVARLDDRFGLLAGGHRGAPARQRTLRAMIDWSWEPLTASERIVLRRLAVHADGCTLQAAEAVCAGSGVKPAHVLDLLARLVDRSLVVVADGPRYRLLESVAAYCLERLAQAGETQDVRQAHARHYTELAEEADRHLRGQDQRAWLERLDQESANLSSALAHTRDEHLALRLVNATAWHLYLRGRLREARRSLERALAMGATPGPARSRATAWQLGLALLQDGGGLDPATLEGFDDPHAQWFLGYALYLAGDLATGEELVTRALPGFQAAGDRWGAAAALAVRANQALTRGDLVALREEGERSAALFRELGDRWGQVQTVYPLASLAEISGDYERATRLCHEGLRLAEELGLCAEVAYKLSGLGRLALLAGDHERARDFHERGRRMAVEQGFGPAEMFAEIGLGLGARRAGRLDEAEAHLRGVLEWYRRIDVEPGNTLILAELGFVAELRGDPDQALALHLEGFALARDVVGDPRAMALALEGLAGAHALAGRPGHAALLLGAATSARRAAGAPLPAAERGDVDRITAAVLRALGGAGFTTAFELGGTLTPQESVHRTAGTHDDRDL